MTTANAENQVEMKKPKSNAISLVAPIVCILLGYVIWRFYLGDPKGFNIVDEAGGFWPHHKGPKGGLHAMYEGGIIVPVLISSLFIVLTFVIERFITISRATGKGNAEVFVKKIQVHLASKNVDEAIEECDKQKGSVANIMRSGLEKYREMAKEKNVDTEHKVAAIKASVEEATSLELPMLEKNLVFLSTIASVATLLGLFGTVLGMIRAFKSLGEEGGAGAASNLAAGISEALYNTALGIGTSAIAIIMYNIFTTKIDAITYSIDESGFTLAQSFEENHK